MSKARIAICHYGISRIARICAPSIEKMLKEPARRLGDVRVFTHLYDQERVESARTGESFALDREDWRLFGSDNIVLDDADRQEIYDYVRVAEKYGDYFGDSGYTLSNLIRQLYSIRSVYRMADAFDPDVWIFARPDLLYHDSFFDCLRDGTRSDGVDIQVPNWQHWNDGWNDRFCICYSRRAADSWANRLDRIDEFCEARGPLHPERLIKHVLLSDIDRRNVSMVGLRGSRVRANGHVFPETFEDYRVYHARKKYMAVKKRAINAVKSVIGMEQRV